MAAAVRWGVASTARIITGAALIIVAVFSGFARGDLIMFQQMGFGVAVALLIDATVIRSVVLPSAWCSSTTATGTCRAGSSGSRTSRSRATWRRKASRGRRSSNAAAAGRVPQWDTGARPAHSARSADAGGAGRRLSTSALGLEGVLTSQVSRQERLGRPRVQQVVSRAKSCVGGDGPRDVAIRHARRRRRRPGRRLVAALNRLGEHIGSTVALILAYTLAAASARTVAPRSLGGGVAAGGLAATCSSLRDSSTCLLLWVAVPARARSDPAGARQAGGGRR